MGKVSYNNGEEILDVIIRDSSLGMIEKRRCNLKDEEETTRIFRWLIDKYGMRIKYKTDLLDIDNEFVKF